MVHTKFSREGTKESMITRDECKRIIYEVSDKWENIFNARGALFLPFESRVVLEVLYVGAVIDNGGFTYLLEGVFEGDENLQHAIAAFRQIGCEEEANVIAFVLSHYLLQAGSSSLDVDKRMSALGAAFPKETIKELDGRFWDLRQEIQQKLADYVTANKSLLEDQLRINLKNYPPLSQ